MKRSEMIEVMLKTVEELMGQRITDEEVLEKILYAMENKGMLPPIKVHPHYTTNVWDKED